MQDNAPTHRTKITQAYLQDNRIELLQWPSVSPDMNTIENVWSLMKRNLKTREYALNSNALFEELDSIWNNFTSEY